MTHANAALTPRHRLIVGRLVVEDGWPISEVAARFQVSWPTVKAGPTASGPAEPPHPTSPRTSTATLDGPVGEQEFAQPLSGSHQVTAAVLPGTDHVPSRLLTNGRDRHHCHFVQAQ